MPKVKIKNHDTPKRRTFKRGELVYNSDEEEDVIYLVTDDEDEEGVIAVVELETGFYSDEEAAEDYTLFNGSITLENG